MPKNPKKLDRFEERLCNAAIQGDLVHFQSIFEENQSQKYATEAFTCAAYHGKWAIVKFLIPFADPMFKESKALRCAVSEGEFEMVKLLLPVSNPYAHEKGQSALVVAAGDGHLEIVNLILGQDQTEKSPSTLSEYFYAMSDAAAAGHLDVVKVLWSLCPPKNSLGLIFAARHHRQQVIDFLFPLSNVEAAIKDLYKTRHFKEAQLLESHLEKEKLNQNLGVANESSLQPKNRL